MSSGKETMKAGPGEHVRLATSTREDPNSFSPASDNELLKTTVRRFFQEIRLDHEEELEEGYRPFNDSEDEDPFSLIALSRLIRKYKEKRMSEPDYFPIFHEMVERQNVVGAIKDFDIMGQEHNQSTLEMTKSRVSSRIRRALY